jgi:hypothetical protein
MKKKQTAVDWLEFEINKRGPKEDNPPQWLKELYEQAKALEKEQIIDAYKQGQYDYEPIRETDAEQYYNETFEA